MHTPRHNLTLNTLSKIAIKSLSRGAKFDSVSIFSRQLGDIPKISLKVTTQK